MRQKHLESALSSIQREFPSPNILLEQYPTSPHLAASVVTLAVQNGNLGPGRTALDLGCGTGMLAIACALVDCDYVIGMDCDDSALQIAIENMIDMELQDRMAFVLGRVKGLAQCSSDVMPGRNNNNKSRRGGGAARGGGGRGRGRGGTSRQHTEKASTTESREIILLDEDGVPVQSNSVDTVLTNPPFGTKNNAGMDLRFLRTATRVARHAVYSFHKSSTRDFLIKQVLEWGMQVEVVAEMRFDLPQTYKFHKEKNVDIQVDLIRVIKTQKSDVTHAEEQI